MPLHVLTNNPKYRVVFLRIQGHSLQTQTKVPSEENFFLRLEGNEGAIKIHLQHFLVKQRWQMVKNNNNNNNNNNSILVLWPKFWEFIILSTYIPLNTWAYLGWHRLVNQLQVLFPETLPYYRSISPWIILISSFQETHIEYVLSKYLLEYLEMNEISPSLNLKDILLEKLTYRRL